MTDSWSEAGSKFWTWLKDNGAVLSESIALRDYRGEGAGRGVVALKDIEEGELLFSIPRSILLSSITSELSKKDALKDELEKLSGWQPLILCMLYESQREDSLWKPYFDVLPKEFTTPMFWAETDLKHLDGTGITEKVGKEDVEKSFEETLLPIIKNHPDIFDEKIHNVHLFHICGSLVMAYSFHDELTPAQPKKQEESTEAEDDEEIEDEEDEEDEGLIAMVPLADMLNHKTGFNNARLFHEPESLQMKAIKKITAGEQIYNTYGDLCNADLLRKYGFVDDVNPFDIVEIKGDLILNVCCPSEQGEETRTKKVDFLLDEEILDDCFVFDNEYEIPPELIVTGSEFKKIVKEDKLPKSTMTAEVQSLLLKCLDERIKQYPTSLEDDETLLSSTQELNLRNALIVRIGEKKILLSTIEKLKKWVPPPSEKKRQAPKNTNAPNKKRK